MMGDRHINSSIRLIIDFIKSCMTAMQFAFSIDPQSQNNKDGCGSLVWVYRSSGYLHNNCVYGNPESPKLEQWPQDPVTHSITD